jgi:hypothetical protein
LDAASISKAIGELVDLGHRSPTILLRVFDRARVSIALTTGNDRDASSKEWFAEGVDAAPAARAASGVGMGDVIFAHEVDLSTTPYERLSHSYALISLEDHLDSLEANAGSTAIALYDPARVRRAPGSDVEFWLDGPARDALLAVIVSVNE